MPHVARSLLRGRRVELDACDPVRDYLHVGDVAEAFAHLLHSGAEGAFHVGGGRPVTVRHLVETLGGLAGRPDLLAFERPAGSPGEPPFLCATRPRCGPSAGAPASGSRTASATPSAGGAGGRPLSRADVTRS